MKKKLVLTNLLISLMGILSFFLVFVKLFIEKYDYNLPIYILIIVMVCAIMTIVDIYLRKSWVINIGILVFALIYLWYFRYEIIGGYMKFFNLVIDEIAYNFKTEMYYATPSGKWLTDADVMLAVGYTMMVLTVVITWMLSKRKMIFIPLLINIFALVIPLVAGIVPPVPVMIICFTFIIEMFVMSGISKNGSGNEEAITSIQWVSMEIGAVVLFISIIFTLIIPQSGYVKPGYFDTVGDFAVGMYDKIESKIESIGSGKGPSIGDDGQMVVENEKLGQTDGINYRFQEMLQVDVSEKANRVYIRQFIGKDYADNSWREIANKDSIEIDELLASSYDTSSQEIISEYLDKFSNFPKRWISIKNTGLRKDRQLMPTYAYTEEPQYFDYESYYKDIESGIRFEYFDVSNEKIGYYDFSENHAFVEYSNYVYKTYLQKNEACDSQFREVLKDFGANTREEVLILAEYIRQHLLERCRYTLTPGKVPQNEDFIDYFYNKSKQGYCTYFATTAVMMFRSKGIPARYVTGFAFDPNENIIDSYEANGERINKVSVDDSCAHAWVEFFLDGFGWVQFEVTPGNFERQDVEPPTREEETMTQAESESHTDKESQSEKPTQSKPQKETTSTATKEPTKKITLSKTTIKNIIMCAAVILVITCSMSFVFIRYRVRKTKYSIRFNENLEKNKVECIKLEYVRFEKILLFANIKRPAEMTYQTFKAQIRNGNLLEDEDIDFVVNMYEKAEFSDDEFADDEIIKLQHIVDDLSNRVYTDIGFFKKLKYKYFRNLI